MVCPDPAKTTTLFGSVHGFAWPRPESRLAALAPPPLSAAGAARFAFPSTASPAATHPTAVGKVRRRPPRPSNGLVGRWATPTPTPPLSPLPGASSAKRHNTKRQVRPRTGRPSRHGPSVVFAYRGRRRSLSLAAGFTLMCVDYRRNTHLYDAGALSANDTTQTPCPSADATSFAARAARGLCLPRPPPLPLPPS